jgi:MSHA pilin protein MshC
MRAVRLRDFPIHGGRQPLLQRWQGFTTIELIVVMILVGILGAIGAARFFNRTGFDAAAYAEQGAAMLRYAQKLAIAQSRPVFVQASKEGIALCYSAASPCASGDRVGVPIGSNSGNAATRAFCAAAGTYIEAWDCEGVPANVSLTVGKANAATFYFNGLGRPFRSADKGDSTFTGQTLTIKGEDLTRTITVEQETGYVH